MERIHQYTSTIEWTGNKGEGTIDASKYERSHTLKIENKSDLLCSSDTPFRGNGTKHNPEDFFLASLSSCHMLWYLHLCADAGVIVTNYVDNPIGIMQEIANGGGHFSKVTLHPTVTVTNEQMIDKAIQLHDAAKQKCFIANSCNFEITHEPIINIHVAH